MNKNKMDTHIHTVKQILKEDCRYMIPIYQRKYQWGNDLLEIFWDDVAATAFLVSEDHDKHQHYMGALILSRSNAEIDTTTTRYVIDGQQRLTTFQIFLTAFREVAKSYELKNSFVTEAKKYLYNDLKEGDDDSDAIFKLAPTVSDREMFYDFIRKDYKDIKYLYWMFYRGDWVPKSTPRRALYAYEYFYKKIELFLLYGPTENSSKSVYSSSHATLDKKLQSKNMDVLFNTLLKHLKLVVITLGEDDDPQAIFETLNSKSAPLLATDLVKNYIFHRAGNEKINDKKIDVDELYEELWSHFDHDWWKIPAPYARPTRPRIDHFLSNILVAETGKKNSVGVLYVEYKKFAVQNGNPRFPSVRDELNTLNNYAPIYEALENREDSNNHDSLLAWLGGKLASWQIKIVYPVIMQTYNSDIERHEKEQIFKLIYSYIVRRAIVGLNAKNYNNVFQTIAHDFIEKGVSLNTLIEYFSDKEDNESIKFPRDIEFKNGVLTSNVYNPLDSKKIKDMLIEFEEFIRPKTAEKIDLVSNNLWVEHILPQNWTDEWPDETGAIIGLYSDEESSMNRRDLIHTFGNLSLLTDSLNQEAGRKPFKEKKKHFKNTYLSLNEKIKQKDQWTEKEIEERGKELSEIAVKIWIDLPTK